MIEKIIENILKAEKDAETIINESEALARRIEHDNHVEIEKLKTAAELAMQAEIKQLTEAAEKEDLSKTEAHASKIKSTVKERNFDKKIIAAKKLIISEFYKTI